MNDDLLNDFLLEAFPNPERKGCPDEDTLQAFAEDRLPPGNPVLGHISSCSECYREYRHYRQDWLEAGGKLAATRPAPPTPIDALVPTPARSQKSSIWAIAAALALVVGGGAYYAGHRNTPAPGALVASVATPVDANVDLFNAVTVRGSSEDSLPLEQVSLPSSVVKLAVTLPRFSQSGPYSILVSKDRAGRNVVAHGTGDAVAAADKVRLVVTLDLRNAAPGTYFLATVRGSDNGTYYYPLKVQ